MGIRFDWEIEAENTRVQRSGEASLFARRRRAARLRFLLFVLFILAVFAGIAAFVVLRLQSVERDIELSLRGTVDAEVTALRLGDFASYSTIQRSASPDWLQYQQRIFDQYQDLKMQPGVQLTGAITDLQIDRTRARVSIQEIVNGIPYTRVWFYWHYDDGWRHVPPDYTFWGELVVQKVDHVTVRYQMVDQAYGKAVVEQVATWMQTACSLLMCSEIPDVTIEVIPDETLQASWAAGDGWRLQVSSPYVRRARSDMPFDTEGQLVIAEKIVDRLITQLSHDLVPVYPSDASYLRQAIMSWMVGQLAQVNTNSYLMTSLTTLYGTQTVGQILTGLRPDSSIALLALVTGKPIEQTALDWRDYLTWRLTVEDDLLQKRDETNYLTLYDTRDAAVRDLAYQRFNVQLNPSTKSVDTVQMEVGSDSSVVLRAVVSVGEAPNVQRQDVSFRLADGVWKRIN